MVVYGKTVSSGRRGRGDVAWRVAVGGAAHTRDWAGDGGGGPPPMIYVNLCGTPSSVDSGGFHGALRPFSLHDSSSQSSASSTASILMKDSSVSIYYFTSQLCWQPAHGRQLGIRGGCSRLSSTAAGELWLSTAIFIGGGRLSTPAAAPPLAAWGAACLEPIFSLALGHR